MRIRVEILKLTALSPDKYNGENGESHQYYRSTVLEYRLPNTLPLKRAHNAARRKTVSNKAGILGRDFMSWAF